jgi:rubrerythrin
MVEALQIALEAERQSAAVYKEAAENAPHEALEKLFKGLATFEQHHYDKVAELAASLQKKGKYIIYEASSVSVPAQLAIEIPEDAAETLTTGKRSLMDILTMAQGIEVQADKRYSALAEQTSDPDGKKMFQQLSEEEQGHLKLLTDVYWNLNDRGVLAWPKM